MVRRYQARAETPPEMPVTVTYLSQSKMMKTSGIERAREKLHKVNTRDMEMFTLCSRNCSYNVAETFENFEVTWNKKVLRCEGF
jgi:hypothetical protein